MSVKIVSKDFVLLNKYRHVHWDMPCYYITYYLDHTHICTEMYRNDIQAEIFTQHPR